MLGDVVNVPYVEGLASFGAAVLFLWSYLMGAGPRVPRCGNSATRRP